MTVPLRSVLEMLASPRARQVNDASTLSELQASAAGLGLAPGLALQWLGTAGFRLTYAGITILIDPYLSRCSASRVLSRRAMTSDPRVLDAHLSRADAILVGHTHFDHALDLPAIAHRDGCTVYGSPSLARLMALHGQSQQAVVVQTGRPFSIGPFDVTFVPSLHSKLVLGLTVPADGEFTCDHLDHLHAGAFHCGRVYGIRIEVAGQTFYHQGSANLIDDAMPRDVDYFLCGIAGRGFTDRYLQRALHRLRPQRVIAHHFDNFFRSVDKPMGFSLNVNLGGFLEEVQQVSKDISVYALPMMQVLGGDRSG